MGDQSPIRGLASWPSLAVLLTLMASALYVKESLVTKRPIRDTSNLDRPADVIPARLWEDPLEAVTLASRKKTQTAPDTTRRSVERSSYSVHAQRTLTDEIRAHRYENGKATPARIRVIVVMVRAGTDEESHEHRIRTRQALQASLRISGFNAAHEDQLRVVRISLLSRGNTTAFNAPIECFDSDGLRTSKSGKEEGDASSEQELSNDTVLVVWLSADHFMVDPLCKLQQLNRAVCDANPVDCSPAKPTVGANSLHGNSDTPKAPKGVDRAAPAVTLQVIGPADSTMFRMMLEEANNLPQATLHGSVIKKNGIPIFSPFCTAEPALLCRGLTNGTKWQDIRELLARAGFQYTPTIGPDDALANTLIEELGRRGSTITGQSGTNQHVAIIAEWDTFYGRAFPITFAAAMAQHGRESRSFAEEFDRITDHGEMPQNLHIFSYMRGIDGRTERSAQGSKPLESASRDARTPDVRESLGNGGIPEFPLGENQLDYIRRMAQRLREMYPPSGGNRLCAIGVVGTDVYDKLLILQALREHFNDVLFFTTDIDARLFHRDQFQTTRNLIVASSYGLRLNDSLQRGAYQGDLSQFRDVYQTSFFVACRMALGTFEKPAGIKGVPVLLQEALLAPRLFEIGRDGAVDLSMTPDDRHRAEAAEQLHPPRLSQVSGVLWSISKLAIVVLVGAALLGITTDLFDRWFGPNRRIPWIGGIVSALVVLLLIGTIAGDQVRDDGEPWSWTSGTSTWPAVVLRVTAVLVGLYLFRKYIDHLNRSDDAIREMIRPVAGAAPQWRHNWKEGWEAVKHLCTWRTLLPTTWHDPSKRLSVARVEQRFRDALSLHDEYRRRGRLAYRFARTMGCVVLYLAFSFVVIRLTGMPYNPYRGGMSFWWNTITLFFSVVVFVALLMFAVDATRLCKWFIEAVGRPSDDCKAALQWPDYAFVDIKLELHLDSTANGSLVTGPVDCSRKYPEINELLSIRAIADRTKAVQKGVVFSSVVLLILIVARSGIFDAWNWPYGLIVVFCMGFGYAFWSLHEMNSLASRERERSLARLEQIHLARLSDSSPREAADRVAKVATLIRENRVGAFASFWENPILNSVLIPTGGLSAMALLQFLIGAK